MSMLPSPLAPPELPNHFSREKSISSADCRVVTDPKQAGPRCTVSRADRGLIRGGTRQFLRAHGSPFSPLWITSFMLAKPKKKRSIGAQHHPLAAGTEIPAAHGVSSLDDRKALPCDSVTSQSQREKPAVQGMWTLVSFREASSEARQSPRR